METLKTCSVSSHRPENLQIRQMKNDRNYWYVLLVLGALAILNAVVCTLSKPNELLQSETVIVVVNVLSFCICISCAFADLGNLAIKTFGRRNHTGFLSNFISEDEVDTRNHLFVYNCLDLAICVIAACISHKLIVNRIDASPNAHLTDSRRFQGYGVALIMMTVTGIVNHMWQRMIMVNHKQAIFLDMHTIDEFSWLSINLATGIFVFLSSRSNQIVQSASFVLSGATIYPCFFYAWLDYRLVGYQESYGVIHEKKTVMTRRDATRVNLTAMNKLIFLGFSVFFLIISLSLVNVNLYALFTEQFYKIFHSSEQKVSSY
uniref:Uncharacterized protein n=1 Tax=Caenorhabditis japonica TaxID=281687 RepID=A0A8R1ERA8_CAEJA